MVKCDGLLLSVSICLLAFSQSSIGTSRVSQTVSPPAATTDPDPNVPIHRVALVTSVVKGLSDPVVISVYSKTLAERNEKKRKFSLPKPKLPGTDTPVPTFVLPGHTPQKAVVDPAETMTPEQLVALSELYLIDGMKDRLTNRYGITVIDMKEVASAMMGLRLSREQIDTSEGAQRLCTRLECDAVIALSAPELTTRQALTRDLVLRTDVHLAALRDPKGGFVASHKQRTRTSSQPTPRTKTPADFTVAGAAVAGRAFLQAGYSSTYPTLARQAALQVAALSLHTLASGELAPLMNRGVRLAVAPTIAPDVADSLVFSAQGRHTELHSVTRLPTDASSYFRPDLLPVLKGEIVDSASTASALRHMGIVTSSLWHDEHSPNLAAVGKLGISLGVQYVLVARVTDVQLAVAPHASNNDQAGGADQQIASQANRAWEREAHAEASGALIRVRDGQLIWTDRGDTTITSREKLSPELLKDGERRIVLQAEKFALIDLKRRFFEFRSQFEQ